MKYVFSMRNVPWKENYRYFPLMAKRFCVWFYWSVCATVHISPLTALFTQSITYIFW